MKKMKMNLEEFAKSVSAKLIKELNAKFPEDVFTTETAVVNKVNNSYFGLQIFKNKEKNKEKRNEIAPCFNLVPFYEDYLVDALDETKIAKELCCCYIESEKNIENYDIFRTWNNVMKNPMEYLRVKLVNIDKSRKLLEEAPHKKLTDEIALICFLQVKQDDSVSSASISNQLLETLGLYEEELFEEAMQQTMENNPPELVFIEDTLLAPILEIEPENILEKGLSSPKNRAPIYLLRTKHSAAAYGATALFYPGVKERLYEIFDCEYYVLPSSIHELIILPIDDCTCTEEQLMTSVEVVNGEEKNILPEEILGYNVLRYNSLTNTLVDVKKNDSLIEDNKETSEDVKLAEIPALGKLC